MDIKRENILKYLFVFFVCTLLMLTLVGCSEKNGKLSNDENLLLEQETEEIKDNVDLSESKVNTTDGMTDDTSLVDEENINENGMLIFGEWKLLEIALVSEGFDDLSSEVYSNFDFDKYLNTIITFSDMYIEISNEKYNRPKYVTGETTLTDYNSNGNYKSPDIYDFILSKDIIITNQDEYEWLSQVPITNYTVTLPDNVYNPIVSYVLVLNNDTLLLGGWGKIFLAERNLN